MAFVAIVSTTRVPNIILEEGYSTQFVSYESNFAYTVRKIIWFPNSLVVAIAR